MLGARYGLYDVTDWKQAFYCDVIIDSWTDCLNKTSAILLNQDSVEEKMAAMDSVIEKVHTPHLNCMENQLGDGRTYIAGNKLTIADCCQTALLTDIWENTQSPFKDKFADLLAKYPKV